jgi:hypothetical protein
MVGRGWLGYGIGMARWLLNDGWRWLRGGLVVAR